MFSECGKQRYSDLVSDFCYIILKVPTGKFSYKSKIFYLLSLVKVELLRNGCPVLNTRAGLPLFASREIFLFLFLNTGSLFKYRV